MCDKQTEPQYKKVIIPLSYDIHSLLCYTINRMSVCLEPGMIDNFPTLLLEVAKDPIAGMVQLYTDLRAYVDEGLLATFVEDSHLVTEEDIFRRAGMEIGEVVDEILAIFKGCEDDIQHYNRAQYITRGIVLLSVNNLEDADLV